MEIKLKDQEYSVENYADVLEQALSDYRLVYQAAKDAGDRGTQREMIRLVYSFPWKPSIGGIADVVNEPRAVILATIQDQGWQR